MFRQSFYAGPGGDAERFNSLRAGKCVQTVCQGFLYKIPSAFQFPSSGKVCSDRKEMKLITGLCAFQFPSSGKVCSDRTLCVKCFLTSPKFQFPSSGKVCSDLSGRPRNGLPDQALYVSIPFERESVFRPIRASHEVAVRHLSFNSLRAGKCVQTHIHGTSRYRHPRWFQFPSSGKVCSDLLNTNHGERGHPKFQFPSSGKVCSDTSSLL